MLESNGKEPMRTAEDRLIHWINERWRIYTRKENGFAPKTWTDDPILASYRFCNVHRENDKVTRWIAHHWRDSNANHSNLVPAMVLARMFNLPDTLNVIGFPHTWDADSMALEVKAVRAAGDKIFNGAYLITTCGVKMDKVDYVFRVADDTRNSIVSIQNTNTLEYWHKLLTQVKGLGDFLAAQVIADLKNTPGHPLWEAPDWWSWCAPGPGSLRGLARLTGVPKVSRGHFAGGALAAYRHLHGRLNPMPNICMQNFQNCLCEFDKYERTYLGEGKPKQRYRSG